MKSKNAKTETFSINTQKSVILKISSNRFIIQVMRSRQDIDKIHGMCIKKSMSPWRTAGHDIWNKQTFLKATPQNSPAGDLTPWHD